MTDDNQYTQLLTSICRDQCVSRYVSYSYDYSYVVVRVNTQSRFCFPVSGIRSYIHPKVSSSQLHLIVITRLLDISLLMYKLKYKYIQSCLQVAKQLIQLCFTQLDTYSKLYSYSYPRNFEAYISYAIHSCNKAHLTVATQLPTHIVIMPRH